MKKVFFVVERGYKRKEKGRVPFFFFVCVFCLFCLFSFFIDRECLFFEHTKMEFFFFVIKILLQVFVRGFETLPRLIYGVVFLLHRRMLLLFLFLRRRFIISIIISVRRRDEPVLHAFDLLRGFRGF